MKLIEYFDDFLISTVNLNKTRLDIAREKIQTISNYIKGNDMFELLTIKISPQGSFKHETIIKPVNEEIWYDVDLLLELKDTNWKPSVYLKNLYFLFKSNDTYKDIVELNTRCVTIQYKDDFHMDLVPCIEKEGSYTVCNLKTEEFEPSDWYWYAEWFKSKNNITSWNLKKTIRLLKYIRDYDNYFDIVSVLLTTFIARQVTEGSWYPDIPSTLLLLIHRLNKEFEWKDRIEDLDLSNPVLPSETFDRHFTQQDYEAFKNTCIKLESQIYDAYHEKDKKTSILKWRVIFGEKFWKTSNRKSIVTRIIDGWRWEKDRWDNYKPTLRVRLSCYRIYKEFKYENTEEYSSFDVFSSGVKVRFKANVQWSIPEWVQVLWKVVNSGEEITESNRRWNFFQWHQIDLKSPNRNPLENWESVTLKWEHWIQCYIIKDKVLIGKSEKFYVIVN